MSKETLSGILNADPNDKWTNIGSFTIAAGVISLLGINIGDMNIS